MLGVCLACLPIFFTGGRIARWEGGVFFAFYLLYVTFLVLAASQHPALRAFSVAVLTIALPLTILGLALTLIHALPRQSTRRGDAGERI